MEHQSGDTTVEHLLRFGTQLKTEDAGGNESVLARTPVLPAGWTSRELFLRDEQTIASTAAGTIISFDATEANEYADLIAASKWGGSLKLIIWETLGSGTPRIKYDGYVFVSRAGADTFFAALDTPSLDTVSGTVSVDDTDGLFAIDVVVDDVTPFAGADYFAMLRGEVFKYTAPP